MKNICHLLAALLFLIFATNTVYSGNPNRTVISANSSAQVSRTDTQDLDIEPYNINYDYLISHEDYGIDCEGELSFSINIPNGISQIRVERGRPNEFNPDRHFYTTIQIIDFDENQTVINYKHVRIRWRTFFRVRYIMEDGSHLCSDEYNVNTYISPSDLETLQNYASIDSPEQDSYDIIYNPDTKVLDVGDNAYLEIYDLLGKLIYQGIVSGSYSLGYLRSKFVIVRCVINNQITTKKIRI